MSATRSFLNASRPLFRSQPLSSAWRARAGQQGASGARGGARGGKRWQSSAAGEQAQQSWFKRMWDSPIGIKTVHFW